MKKGAGEDNNDTNIESLPADPASFNIPLSSNIVLKLLAGEIRQEKETKRIWI